jgi:hypothetical protein
MGPVRGAFHDRIGRAVGVDDRRRERAAAFMDAEGEVVRQRVDMRGGDVGVVREILLRVERRRGQAALAPAELMKVLERIDAAAATSA